MPQLYTVKKQNKGQRRWPTGSNAKHCTFSLTAEVLLTSWPLGALLNWLVTKFREVPLFGVCLCLLCLLFYSITSVHPRHLCLYERLSEGSYINVSWCYSCRRWSLSRYLQLHLLLLHNTFPRPLGFRGQEYFCEIEFAVFSFRILNIDLRTFQRSSCMNVCHLFKSGCWCRWLGLLTQLLDLDL